MSDIAIKIESLGSRVKRSRNGVETRFTANAIVVYGNRYRYGAAQSVSSNLRAFYTS